MADLEEMEELEEELEDLLETTSAALKKLMSGKEGLTGREREAKVDYLTDRIKRCKDVVHGLEVGTRELSAMEADPWKKKIKKFKSDIEDLLSDLEFAQEHDELTGGPGRKKKKNLDAMTADEVLDDARAVQEDDLDRLDGTLQVIEDSKAVGTGIMQNLDEQTAALERASGHVQDIESNMKLAGAELRSFITRMATDKIIMCFLCLIVFAVAGLIVWSLIDPEADTAVPDQYKGTVNVTTAGASTVVPDRAVNATTGP